MRSALLCVFLAFIVQEGSWADDDFKPMPIPVNEWHPFEGRQERAGTLHEAYSTDEPPAVAAVPAHYWEDALRHSVYLTLVRDRIDQLISKGDVISPDSKPDHLATKEDDDLDLWEKIKSATFDRIKEDEQGSLGDVTIMAKGRLIEEKGKFRFTEDEKSKEKCEDEKCMKGVKAFWSVKRVRQRDDEISPGRYHYELTFSVNSHMPKKQKKPYENPVRTFTVRESDPEKVVDIPQEDRSHVQYPQPSQTHRPERAIWFHKNIVPTQRHQSRQYNSLERIFSSLFSDDDDYEPPRYRPNPHHAPPPMYNPQFSKAGYVGSPSDQQKRLTPYPYKPQSTKYSRPPFGPPPYSHPHHVEQHPHHVEQHPHYVEQHPHHVEQHPHHAEQHPHHVEPEHYGNGNIPYGPPQDHRYVSPNKVIKTTRPAVLPTPPETHRNWTSDGENNNTDPTTSTPETATVYKTYSNKPRPPPLKINYMSDYVRPPVYNAPPGVFVTMDKKPFKPLPPMKYYHSKPIKQLRPIDFRPSPQVLDMQQFSEPDPLFDTAFRPMAWNNSNSTSSTTEKIEVAESSVPVNNTRKSVTKGKKPPKKHENIKPGTTSTPDIITANNESIEDNDSLEWANVVGAFSKTTPMASQKEKHEDMERTTQSQTSTTIASTTGKRRTTTTTTEAVEELTTTAKPKKRTRPPPKFTKPDKVKKHKRITTTTTKAPAVKTTQDLTPQASAAAATKPSTQRPVSTSPVTTTSTSTTTTPRPTTTTKAATTTTTQPASTSTETKLTASQQKSKNRFRISTLMQKGTSVKHDKWSATTAPDSSQQKLALPLVSKNPPRRKGSNFQGYVSSTTPMSPEKQNKELLYSNKYNSNLEVMPLSTSTATYDDTAYQYDYSTSHDGDDIFENDEDEDSDELDTKEYIFQSSSTTPSEKTNEIGDQEEPHTTEQILTSPHAAPKNKTKCKKKKNQTTTPVDLLEESDSMSTSAPLTTESSTPSIFEELFDAFNLDEKKEEQASKSTTQADRDQSQQESKNHGEFVKLDDDLQDFLDSLDKENNNNDSEIDESEYEDDADDEPAIDEDDSPYNNDEESASPRDAPDGYDYNDRYSLLELMAME